MLRKVLSITDEAYEAHHIIPWAKSDHELIQLAAKDGHHMNKSANGIPAKKYLIGGGGTHANHPQYDEKVLNKLQEKMNELTAIYGTNIPSSAARESVEELQDYIRSIIVANSNTKMNDLQF
jgi:A nuclease family of the HNH/ENDO VII superfamily with conserved AHH